jgi:hypothetical protein
MTIKHYFAILVLLGFIACEGPSPVVEVKPASDSLIASQKRYDSIQRATDSLAIKVYVDKTGKITANGQLVSLITLDSSFSKLKTIKGAVYYSRDNVQQDPPEESMKVMELIIKYELPVRFYTDKTFTQVANPK